MIAILIRRLAALLPAMLLVLTPLLLSLGAPGARADIVVNVDQGASAPLPIAITEIAGSPVGGQISQVVSADLARSGLFRPLDPAGFPSVADVDVQPGFDAWKAIGAQGLVTGKAAGDGEGRLSVDFRLWDVYAGQQLLGLQFSSAPENWRRIAHKIADAIYEKLTGQPGYFDTRIVFVAESGDKLHPVRRLAIMDEDGANPSYLTSGASLVFTPRFSPTSQEITYMALGPNGSTLWLFDIDTGRREALGTFNGMVFAPRFSPDGRRVAFSAVRDGNTDIYVMDLGSHAVRRLTTDPAIDTSPSFSPDGSRIVFNSDRGGAPELYVMNADGGAVQRISFGAGRYTAPTWSPDGKFIAFTRQEGDTFHIGVMRPDGSGERDLTAGFLDEGATWAPNSRTLMFARKTRGGPTRLYTVDLSGRPAQPEPYPLPASDPAWSPLLH